MAAGQRSSVRAELVPGEALETTIDVEGRKLMRAEERKASAEAVHVVELEQARQQTADLGEVLSRNAGVSVQRSVWLRRTRRRRAYPVVQPGPVATRPVSATGTSKI